MNVIIASHNEGKIEEFKALLGDLNLTISSLKDYPEIPEIEETGNTFEANARLKAETIAQQFNAVVLADDSGLVVPALNGEPGVYSARYSGENATDQTNNAKLLLNMQDLVNQARSAYFISVLVVAHPAQTSLVVEGRVEGIIAQEPVGERGFGYDPLFYYPPMQRTFAEMSLTEKNKLSHRANALNKLVEALPAWLKELNNIENNGVK